MRKSENSPSSQSNPAEKVEQKLEAMEQGLEVLGTYGEAVRVDDDLYGTRLTVQRVSAYSPEGHYRYDQDGIPFPHSEIEGQVVVYREDDASFAAQLSLGKKRDQSIGKADPHHVMAVISGKSSGHIFTRDAGGVHWKISVNKAEPQEGKNR